MSDDQGAAGLVEFVAKALVSDTDAVRVRSVDDGRVLELETTESDRGRVIGRQGRVAKAMRVLLAVSGHGGDTRLEVVD